MGFFNLVQTVVVLTCLSGMVGCGKSGDVPNPSGDINAPQSNNNPSNPTPPGNPAGPVTMSLTYYSLTKPVASWTTSGVTTTLYGIGSCTIVNSVTYCWDDGTKTHVGPTVGAQYWALNSAFQICPNFNGICSTDLMIQPVIMSPNVIAKLNTQQSNSRRTVAEVLAGTPTTITCTVLSNNNLDCGSFVVDVNQVPL